MKPRRFNKEWDLCTRDLWKPSGNLKIENSFLWANAESQHRDIHVGISSQIRGSSFILCLSGPNAAQQHHNDWAWCRRYFRMICQLVWLWQSWRPRKIQWRSGLILLASWLVQRVKWFDGDNNDGCCQLLQIANAQLEADRYGLTASPGVKGNAISHREQPDDLLSVLGHSMSTIYATIDGCCY